MLMNWSLSERYHLNQQSVVPAMLEQEVLELGVGLAGDAYLDSVRRNAGW